MRKCGGSAGARSPLVLLRNQRRRQRGMRTPRCFVFDPFRLDVLDERLWRRNRSIPLGRKAFAVLDRLLNQAGQLVTKDDLLAAAWPDTAVSDAVLTTAIRELREALGESGRAPRYIQTV